MKLLILLIIPLLAICRSHVTIFNNATKWPPTMMTYSKPHQDTRCTADLNNILGVGQRTTIKGYNKICISYSPVFPGWGDVRFFDNVSYVELRAKVTNHYLEYYFILNTAPEIIKINDLQPV